MNEFALVEIVTNVGDDLIAKFVEMNGELSKYNEAALVNLIKTCESILEANRGMKKFTVMKQVVESGKTES